MYPWQHVVVSMETQHIHGERFALLKMIFMYIHVHVRVLSMWLSWKTQIEIYLTLSVLSMCFLWLSWKTQIFPNLSFEL